MRYPKLQALFLSKISLISTILITLNPLLFVVAQPNRIDSTEARQLLNLATQNSLNQNYPAAIKAAQQSLSIFQSKNDRRGEGEAWFTLTTIYSVTGEIGNMKVSLEKGIRISQENGFTDLKCAFISQSLQIDALLNQYFDYEKEIKSCLDFAQSNGNKTIQFFSLFNLGLIAVRKQDYNAAKIYLERALPFTRESKTPTKVVRSVEAVSLIYLGGIHYKQGQNEKAIDLLNQALRLSQDNNLASAKNSSLHTLSTISRESGEYQEALSYAEKMTESVEGGLSKLIKPGSLGIIYYHLGEIEKAEKYLYEASVVMDEWTRNNESLEDSSKISLLENILNIYKPLAVVQSALGKSPYSSLISLESGRTRAFKDLFNKKQKTNSFSKPTIAGLRSAAIQRKATIIEYNIIPRIDKNDSRPQDELFIHVILPSGDIKFIKIPIDSSSFSGIIADNRKTINNNLIATRSSRDNYPQLYPGQNIKLRNDPVNAPSRRIISVNIPANTAEVSSLSNDSPPESVPFKQIIPLDQANNARYATLQKLYKLLIKPIEKVLPSNPEQPVIFIPDGALYDVTFAALQDEDGKYLIDKHTIYTSPSIGVLTQTSQLRRQTANKFGNALIVGNPAMPNPRNVYTDEPLRNLPASTTEANSIAEILSTRPLLGAQATESVVKSRFAQSQILHFATHGILDEKEPGKSSVVFASDSQNDGYLTVDEILGLKLSADLVVVSACDTGRGKITGDGIVGLSRAFITAGTPSIIVSSWAVNDNSNAELMTEFYRQWRSGKSKAQSLRQAMLITRQKYPDPYNWAAMNLIGEGD
jgi:CHAT domain-containing protein